MKKISFFPVPDSLDGLPTDIRKRILAVQEKAGFIPNVFLMLAHRPAEFRAFFAYHDALMERESPTLSLAEREMIVVAMSAQHECLYCVVAHGALLRIYTKQPHLSDQIAINFRTAPLTEKQRVMLEYTYYLAIERGVMTEEWLTKLQALGFSMDDIWDMGAIAAFFGLSNRLVSMAGTPPNDEFYLLGRIPREK
ncbi:MAG TPA: peroxidase-related enzyme [Thiopseudomonas sp.]|nr:peroxidase-related enzyme [Thiopseudomonas sp.]